MVENGADLIVKLNLSYRIQMSYLIILYCFIFLPVAVLVLFSFQDGQLPIPPFNGVSFKWYNEIFADRKLMSALGNSLIVAVVSSAVACSFGFLAAYGFSRYYLPASTFQRALLAAPMSVSYLIIALGLLATFNWLGIRLSLWTVGVGHVVINLPLCFAIIYASMGDHQKSIERAASDLGANGFQIMYLVTVPMLMPSILAAFFLSITFSWDEFIISFLLSRFDVTLPVEIWSLLRSGLNPKANAIGSLVFIASTILIIVLEVAIFHRSKNK